MSSLTIQAHLVHHARRILVPALLLLFATTVRAQLAPLEAGTDLRLAVLGGNTIEGRLVRLNADTLVVHGEATGDYSAVDHLFALEEILRLERRVPRSARSGAGRGALWGALIGGLGGAAFGLTWDSSCGLCLSPGGNALFGAALFGIPCTLVGAVVGATSPGGTWEDVPIETVPSR